MKWHEGIDDPDLKKANSVVIFSSQWLQSFDVRIANGHHAQTPTPYQ
jgi:hypothetical protein